MTSRSLRVPLAVDAQLRVRLGPLVVPLRAVVLCAAVSPLAYLLLSLDLPGLWGVGGALFLLVLAAMCGSPERQGVWLGTHHLYAHAWRLMPNAVIDGEPRRARVQQLPSGVMVQAVAQRRSLPPRVLPSAVRWLGAVPVVAATGLGVLHVEPGGRCAVLVLDGPPVSPASDAYLSWCQRLCAWFSAQQCPAQVVSTMTHHDGERVAEAFDSRVAGWPATPLRQLEREVVTGLSAHAIGLRHFVVLMPGSAGSDGLPFRAAPWRAARARAVSEEEVTRVLQTAARTALSFGLAVRPADRDDIAALVGGSALGSQSIFAGREVCHAGGRHQVVLAVVALPGFIDPGCVVDAMLRARAAGTASLHLLPVSAETAQRHLHRRSAMLRYASQGPDSIEAQVALQDAADATAALAARDMVAVRVALTVVITDHHRDDAVAAAERFTAVLAGRGFRVTEVTGPALLPLFAATPGGTPLRRTLILTTEAVAARMVPCLGTPFGDISAPLLGVNGITGAPLHLSVWRQANHNAVIVGSSGAGKSVATKTLLVRHLMEGAMAAVIDPDSEYEGVMRSVGGLHYELGDDSLNPLAVAAEASADDAAGMILPILSVMAGDERGTADRRPVRRLRDEDQGWLHSELVEFLRARRLAGGGEPVLGDLVDHLAREASSATLTDAERTRARVITARLRRFTQGPRARVFNRPSTFTVADRPVAVGMRRFAMSYGADLTPALAVLLTALLGAVEQRRGRLLVVVDEAHRITSDPDAGEVLGQLVRQARKHGAGVWMVSQRIDDFVSTDLGRTLAATAATKLVLGTEETVVSDVASVFALSADEVAAICPMQRGCGVVIAGGERAVVRVVPGDALLAVSSTSP